MRLMKSIFVLPVFAALVIANFALLSCSYPDLENGSDPSLLIQNVTIIDALNGVRTGYDVVVIGGQIETVAPTDTLRIEPRQVIDGTAKYLIPGLWDAHVHLAFTPEIDYTTFFPLSLAHGVTSLRDTGGHLDQLAPAIAMAKSEAVTPDLYISGPLIDGPLRVYDGRSVSNPDLSVSVETSSQAKNKVDDLVAAGVDFVKAYEMLSPEAFRAIAERARKHKLPVAAHTPLSMSVMEAIEAGANDMQHLRNIEFDCASNALALYDERQKMLEVNKADTPAALRGKIHKKMRALALPNYDDGRCLDVIAALAHAKVYQTPTLVISRFFSRKLFADATYRQSFDWMPNDVAQSWKERSQKLVNLTVNPQTAAFDDWIMDMIPRLHEGGVPIMAGTDAPIGFLTPGASLHEELVELVYAGLTPLEAIGAATLTPAQFFNIDTERGTIMPNMKADLVLLTKNPLENIRHINSIHTVIKDGHVLNRKALDTLLAKPAHIRK